MNKVPISLFQKTRLRLTMGYASVITILLTLLGVGVYEAIIHAHRITLEQELSIVAGTLHDNLQSLLKTPNKLEKDVLTLLPHLCQKNQSCLSLEKSSNYRINPLKEDKYYIKFFTLSGDLIAISGQQPQNTSLIKQQPTGEIIQDAQGIRYLQITHLLHTKSDQHWGYLIVGRSLQDFDRYLQTVGLILLLGLPLGIILVGFSAWWLSGIAIKPLYQAYQQMQQFTADAAHELRTPLAAIQATIDSTLMLPNFSEPETRETLTTLNRQNRRLSQLVADLLMLSRLDYHLTLNSSLFLRKTSVCLQDVINDLTEELSSFAYNSQITLETEIKVTQSLDIIGDNEKIYRLLFNIVSNAIQYTPEKGKVTLTLEKNQKFAVIIVKDTGIGIDSQEIDLIFQRFYRLDKARSRRQGGSGLGLPIAKAIAQGHHGTIEIQSQMDQGTQVMIKLPTDH